MALRLRRRATTSSSGGGSEFEVKSEDLHALFVATKTFDKKVYASTRAAMRDSAKPMISAVRRNVLQVPSSGKYRGGLRMKIAAGISASVSATKTGAGIRVKTSARKLPPGKRSLVKAFELKTFRHPVYPDARQVRDSRTRSSRLLARARGRQVGSWKWVEQPGNPYFNDTVRKQRVFVRDRLAKAYLDAWDNLPNTDVTGGI